MHLWRHTPEADECFHDEEDPSSCNSCGEETDKSEYGKIGKGHFCKPDSRDHVQEVEETLSECDQGREQQSHTFWQPEQRFSLIIRHPALTHLVIVLNYPLCQRG